MLFKAKKVFTTDLVKVSSLNAVATIVRMLTGLISVKVVAAVIGPSGVALLGQLNNFSQIVLSISNGGINAGMTKYVSEFSDSKDDFNLYLGTGFWITLVLSVGSSIILLLGSEYFAVLILHDIRYNKVFYIFGCTLIFYSFNALLLSVINGFKEYKKYFIVNITGSIVGLAFSVLLVTNFGIYGALISTVTFQSIIFFITLLVISKSYWFKYKLFLSKISRKIIVKLGKYSMMAIVSAVTVPAGQLIVRNLITTNNTITEAGLWEGINRISGMYSMVITASLSVYFLPKLSELKTEMELRREIFSFYKLIIPFLILTTLIIYLFRVVIISVLFTSEFVGMKDLFAFQLVGDVFRIMGWVLGYLLLAKAMAKIYILMELVNFILLVLVSYFLVKSFGSMGATIASAVVYLNYLIVLSFVFRKLLFGNR